MYVKSRFFLSLAGWVETIVITMIFVMVAKIFNDPFSLKSYFPWIWFGPVLVALRYGVFLSLFSIVLLLFSFLHNDRSLLYTVHFQIFLLGGFLITLICGVAQGAWTKKICYSEEISKYLQQRIQNIAYSFKLIKLAYSRLEHTFISRPVTIRSSLDELREMHAKETSLLLSATMTRFLNMLALQCSFEVAGMFSVENSVILETPIASIGMMPSINKTDFLIKTCIESCEITYVRSEEILKGHISEYLVVAPFKNQKNEIYALLVIKEMPFLSLNNENLGVMNLLLQYFVEGNPVKNAELILEAYPDCPVIFANELQRLTNLCNLTGKDSAVVAFTFLRTPHQDDYLFFLKKEKRGIDSSWQKIQGETKVLFVLMPFINRSGVDIYRQRINDSLKNEFNIELNSEYVKYKSSQVSLFSQPVKLIQDLLSI